MDAKVEKIENIMEEEREKIRINAEREYTDYFLDLVGLNVGDVVPCEFYISTGDENHITFPVAEAEGIIKKDEHGIAYVESIEQLSNASFEDNHEIGENHRTRWVYKQENLKISIDNIILEKIFHKND